MAKRFALVPEEWLDQLKRKSTPADIPDLERPDAAIEDGNNTIEVLERHQQPPQEKQSENAANFAILLPKLLRSRATVLCHYVWPYITVSVNNRILYKSDGVDEIVGSNIIDMLRYVLSNKSLKIDRPPDASEFLELCKASGVPEYIFAHRLNGTTNNRATDDIAIPSEEVFQWIKLY